MIKLLFLLLSAVVANAAPFCPVTQWTDTERRANGSFVLGWFAPDDITVSGSSVTSWNDKTGLGHHLVQATGANQPFKTRSDNQANYLLQSQTFQTTWALTRLNAFGATDTGGAGAGSFADTSRTTDPLGGNTADFIQEDSTVNATHQTTQSYVKGYPGNWVFSLSVKQAGRANVQLTIDDASSANVKCFYDVNAGTVGATASGGGGSSPAGTITSQGNGWYLCTLSGTFTVNPKRGIIQLANTTPTVTYSGNNTSGLYVWGASSRPATADSTYLVTTTAQELAGLNGYALVSLNGTAQYLKASTFTWQQPEAISAVIRQDSWTANDYLWEANASAGGRVRQLGTSPGIDIAAGSSAVTNSDLTLGVFKVLSARYSGASSSLLVNAGTETIGDVGSGSMSGFTLGVNAAGASGFSDIAVAELMFFSTTNDFRRAYIARIFNRKYNLGF